MFSFLLRERSRRLYDLLECSGTVIFARSMGGGPRTFPGGLNKWQWKRMHEKRAKEKEKRLLAQEKQLYEARIRSEIRARLAGGPDQVVDDPSSTHGPMTPKDHIKALADRFMKEGAEDLWNEEDGPLRPPPPPSTSRSNRRPGSIQSPIDLRRLVSDAESKFSSHSSGMNSVGGSSNCNHVKSRNYSVQTRVRFRRNESSESELDSSLSNDSHVRKGNFKSFSNSRNVNDKMNGNFLRPRKKMYFRNDDSSSSDDDSDFDAEDDVAGPSAGDSRWPRLSLGGAESEEDEKGTRGGIGMRKLGSSASLGKYDMKIKKRVPLQHLEKETDFLQEVEMLRHELNRKKMAENQGGNIEEDSLLTQKRFDECNISPLTNKALALAGYRQMTRVQEAALPVCLEGKDALFKAKTGTGKSIAFLLPAIETVLKASANSNQRVPPIDVLILCPTRELASQLAAEAKALLKYHEGIGVQTLVGGTRFKVDQKRLESDPCQIIVATPGRLLDHIESKSGLSVRLMGLKILILDEADHLLDLGFRKDIEKIVDSLPRKRQSLLFSATIPKEVRRISQLVLKREHDFIDTVGIGSIETPLKVKQSCLVVPHEQHFQVIFRLLKEHVLQTPDYKVMVFCTTGMVTSLLYMLFREMKMNVREIHSRKPQIFRTRISDEFRESKRLILVTSDVSSRGMNYPDVTLVIQVGIPYDREQYIHRLGRTGREGKEGEGILLLAPWEEYFLNEIKDLPMEKLPLPSLDPESKLKVEDSLSKVDTSVKEAAYHAWLGYYNSISEIGRDKTTLVELAKRFSDSIGLQNPPALFRKTALKMGLKDIPGIRIRK
ncbi:probable DEAD-box ATP-dependent RNA helicase 48 [Punica granatum]|uniref:ATP-dependent RNA helicase n=2 Tax=Punica granatum TaxID=22663 RepID=A0A218XLH5_PUNGR|nr:probable DEAD-box ATP-dependent RNA helicase 48 [Punica granatum]OWM85331.1 hypothetical protein CDL15_Pgr028118 [Punica granatum]PKI55245.1 hypothetical protein CRG98_024362 [Punica granatum]